MDGCYQVVCVPRFDCKVMLLILNIRKRTPMTRNIGSFSIQLFNTIGPYILGRIGIFSRPSKMGNTCLPYICVISSAYPRVLNLWPQELVSIYLSKKSARRGQLGACAIINNSPPSVTRRKIRSMSRIPLCCTDTSMMPG